MRIINLLHAQNMGGVDQVFRDYNQVFIDNGNDLALVISNNGKDDYALPGLKKIYKLKNFNQILDIIHLLFIIYSFKPQIIICHTNRTMNWMRWIKFIISAKTIAVNHSSTYKKSLYCEYVFSVNKEIRDLIIKEGKSKEHSIFIPNMIIFDPDMKFNNKTFHNPIKIGMFGRFEPRKGFDILIKAAAILKEKNLEFKIIIGGFSIENSSYNEDTIKNLVTDYKLTEVTEFVGVVVNKSEFFDKIDIFCVPSNEEPFGMVIIESFVNSTPVISSNTHGGKLIIEDGKDGILFEVANHQALAEKIEYLINHQDKAKEIAKNAFEKVKEKYSAQQIGKMLQNELEKIAHPNQTPSLL